MWGRCRCRGLRRRAGPQPQVTTCPRCTSCDTTAPKSTASPRLREGQTSTIIIWILLLLPIRSTNCHHKQQQQPMTPPMIITPPHTMRLSWCTARSFRLIKDLPVVVVIRKYIKSVTKKQNQNILGQGCMGWSQAMLLDQAKH